MTWDRVAIVERQLDEAIASAAAGSTRLAAGEPLRPGGDLTASAALALFEDQRSTSPPVS